MSDSPRILFGAPLNTDAELIRVYKRVSFRGQTSLQRMQAREGTTLVEVFRVDELSAADVRSMWGPGNYEVRRGDGKNNARLLTFSIAEQINEAPPQPLAAPPQPQPAPAPAPMPDMGDAELGGMMKLVSLLQSAEQRGRESTEAAARRQVDWMAGVTKSFLDQQRDTMNTTVALFKDATGIKVGALRDQISAQDKVYGHRAKAQSEAARYERDLAVEKAKAKGKSSPLDGLAEVVPQLLSAYQATQLAKAGVTLEPEPADEPADEPPVVNIELGGAPLPQAAE